MRTTIVTAVAGVAGFGLVVWLADLPVLARLVAVTLFGVKLAAVVAHDIRVSRRPPVVSLHVVGTENSLERFLKGD